MLRPGSSTYFAPDMWSATYLPIAGGMIGSSACWTTRVGTRTVGSSARTSNSDTSGIMRATVAGLAARRSMPSPRCPDLLVPRHLRIEDMLVFARSPHGDHGIEEFLRDQPSDVQTRIRVDLQHDQRGGAGRMCRCEQRRRRKRAVDRDEHRLRIPRSSSTAVMLSAHCSKVGSAPAAAGSEAPVPGKSKKISRPSDVIASTHP